MPEPHTPTETPLCTCPKGGCVALDAGSMLVIDGGQTVIIRQAHSMKCQLLEHDRAARAPNPAA